jgi:S-phase kinase-associated protein 1
MNFPNLEEVYDIIAAANYLDVPNLVELGCAKVGSLMKNKTIPELRQMFKITNDFTPEEEKTILEGRADIWGDEDDEGDENE